MSAVPFERGGEKLGRGGEVGGDRNLDFVGMRGTGGEQQGYEKSSHGSVPKQSE